MSKMSVPQVAERLGVSPARVRQRIDDGSLVAEKIGGRWLVDLEASQPAPAQIGRPVAPFSVWWSIVAAEIAKAAMHPVDAAELRKPLQPAADAAAIRKSARPAVDLPGIQKALKPAADSAAIEQALLPRMKLAEIVLANVEPMQAPEHGNEAAEPDWVMDGFVAEARHLSRSSRNRAVRRVAEAVENRDHDALLAWLNNRAARRLYVAAPADLKSLREDGRLVMSGLSHPGSGMDDPRIVEGYVDADELDAVVADYWLERPNIDERPNVVVHAAPVRPPAVGLMLLAADLSEHGGPREVSRAHELLDEWMDALLPARSSKGSA